MYNNIIDAGIFELRFFLVLDFVLSIRVLPPRSVAPILAPCRVGPLRFRVLRFGSSHMS